MAPQLRDHDRYDILGEHGRGGLGRVSRAHDRELGRDIAIKELISRGHLSEIRFLREALITARLEHPGIVPVYEAGRWADGTPFYAMKLVSGRPLRELIAERKTVDERIGLLHHVIAVADAIAYAHGRSIIHRDLKPSNVIIGDFGETVVIDWGLAKDLTATEETAIGGGPFREYRDEGLTSAGTVLGTPAYMAPEQARGEPVDQRADVFAIGAMLWELCSLHKLPPNFSGQRRRLLRKSGIDSDLITIIEKAVDPDPARRYPDAGALTSDLKAFKAGARIAARRYSLLALLAHWVRRRRSLALAAAMMLALAVAGSALYVRSITVERNRADASEASAMRAQATAQASLGALTLQHAELLLATDPSAAIDALAAYHGDDLDQAHQIRSAALAKGVASLRATPHTDNIIWAEGTNHGILSMGLDGTITRTLPGGISIALARGVSPRGLFAYSAVRRLLIYECDPNDLCALDIARENAMSPERFLHGTASINLSLSPNGSKLATISRTATLQVYDISDLSHTRELFRRASASGSGILFVGEDTVAVAGRLGLTLVHPQEGSSTETLPIMHSSAWDADPNGRLLALATISGEAYTATIDPVRITSQETVCQGRVSGIKFIPGGSRVAYACSEGTIGIWEFQKHTVIPQAHLDGHADRLSVSASGDYVIAAGGNGTLTALDVDTEIVTSYKGHNFRLLSISPPSSKFPFFISGDVRGALRAWPLPKRYGRLIANVHRRFRAAFFSNGSLITTTQYPELTAYSSSAGIRNVQPHQYDAMHIAHTADRRTFATYGSTDTVEIWSAPELLPKRTLATNHGIVSYVEFISNSDDFVSAGRDGRLVRWSVAGQATELARLDQPIERFALGPTLGSAFMIASDGGLWWANGAEHTIPLTRGSTPTTYLVSSPDRRLIYVGDASGNVAIIDANTALQTPVLHAGDAIQTISFSHDERIIAISSNDGTLHIGTRQDDRRVVSPISWVALHARTRGIAFTPDGLVIAACTDGSVLIYSVSQHREVYLILGTLDLTYAIVSDDAQSATILDTEGRIIQVRLDIVRASLGQQDI